MVSIACKLGDPGLLGLRCWGAGRVQGEAGMQEQNREAAAREDERVMDSPSKEGLSCTPGEVSSREHAEAF